MNGTGRNSGDRARFGRYDLKRRLGRGGTGDVYEAEDTITQRIVALKVLPPVFTHDRVFCARLERASRVVGQLHEPHIVPIYDYGEIDGQQFVAMQLIEGTDLSTRLKRLGSLPAPCAVAIVRQIASALDAAHALGIIHGDVKPSNILITGDDVAQLVDFGISDAAPHKGVTRVVGSAVATWKYTAPERFTAPVAGPKVDIYALACVLHECLTGSPPYLTDSVGALISAHLGEPVPVLSRSQHGISPAFDDVIAKGMAKDPAQRYPTAGDLALAACQALSRPDQDRVDERLEPGHQRSGPKGGSESELPSVPAVFAAPPVPTSQPSAAPFEHEPRPRHVRLSPSLTGQSAQTAVAAAPRGPASSGWPSQMRTPRPELQPIWSRPPKPRRRLVLTAVAIVVTVAAGGIAAWLQHSGHSTPPDLGDHSTPSAASAPAAQTRLLSLLPPGFQPPVCRPITPPPDALAEVSCENNSDPDGPTSATYLLFPETSSLRGAFTRIVQGSNVIECPGRIQSPGPWHANATPDKASGTLLCATQRESPIVAWTDDTELVVGLVRGEQHGPTIDRLYAWWTSHS